MSIEDKVKGTAKRVKEAVEQIREGFDNGSYLQKAKGVAAYLKAKGQETGTQLWNKYQELTKKK